MLFILYICEVSDTLIDYCLRKTLLLFFLIGILHSESFSQKKIQCTQPVISAGSSVTICNGGVTTLTATVTSPTVADYSYAWTPNNGSLGTPNAVITPLTQTTTASPSVTTTYTLIVTDNLGCTSNPSTVTVTVNPSPTVSITGNNTVCAGSSVSLSASGAASYVWLPGNQSSSTISVSPTTATNYTVTGTDANACTNTSTHSISIAPQSTVNAGPAVSICNGSSVTLNGSGNGTYLWSPSAGLSSTTNANPTATPTISTTYTLTVTNSCGSASNSVTITLNALPSVNAGSDVTICFGNNTFLLATGSGAYSWTPTSGLSCTTCPNPIATPTASTSYSVTITDVCGSSSDDVMVTVGNPLATLNGASTICAGDALTLTAQGGGSYSWSTGSSATSIIVTPTITSGYTVTVTDAYGCTDNDNATVFVNPIPNLNISGNNSVCLGDSAVLSATGGVTYSWSTGATSTSIIVYPTSTSTYTVVATSAFNCTSVGTYTVSITPQPIAIVSAVSNTICSGSSTSLSASGGSSYAWSPSAGLNQTNISNPVSSAMSSITYTVIVSAGTCADTASILITVNPTPTVTITASSATICVGSCNSLSASGGSNYTWSPGGQTTSAIIICPATSTSYTATTVDANGCSDTAIANITVLPNISALATGDTILCLGDISTLTAQGGGVYFWSTGATTSSIPVAPAANTSYTVIVSNGTCSDTALINVLVHPVPTALATALPYTINIGAQTALTGSASTNTYTWTPSYALSCTTCSNPVASPTVTTIYVVSTLDSNGCFASDTVIVNVTQECDEVFVPSAFSPNADGRNDVLFVRNPCVLEMEFRIYDRWGEKVFSTTDVKVGWDGMFRGKPVDPAVFFYMLKVNFFTGASKEQNGNITLVR